jgi:hypothetical protein
MMVLTLTLTHIAGIILIIGVTICIHKINISADSFVIWNGFRPVVTVEREREKEGEGARVKERDNERVRE